MTFLTPYETLTLSKLKTDKIETELKTSRIRGSLEMIVSCDNAAHPELLEPGDILHVPKARPNSNLYLVVDKPYSNKETPAFIHPLVFDKEKDKQLIAVDLRPFSKLVETTGKTHISTSYGWNFMLLRGRLTDMWVNGGVDTLKSVGAFPLVMFSKWITTSVTNKLMLDPQTQLKLSALSGYFYLSLFGDEATHTVNQVAAHISRHCHVDLNTATAVIEQAGEVNTVEKFCEALERVTEDVRLKGFDPAILYTVLSWTWFGGNDKSVPVVALEHPPTWMAMLFSAVSEAIYNKTGLLKLMDRGDLKKQSSDFQLSLVSALKGYGY